MSTAIRSTSEERLRGALNRLINGAATQCDGRLTVTNLATEAGVSRATANRADAIVTALREAKAEQALRRQPDRVSDTAAMLREANNIIAQHAQAIALHAHEQQRQALRGCDHDRVIAFKKRRKL